MNGATVMRRHMLILLGLLATALLAGCGGSGGTGVVAEPISPERLLQSASASADATTGRFAFDMQMTVPGVEDTLAFSGDGAFDADAGRASMSLDMSSFATLLGQAFAGFGATGIDLGAAEKWKIEVVQDGLVVYMRFPLLDEKLPDGKSWVKIDAAAAAQAEGFDLDQLRQFTENDPRKTLDYLRAVAGKIVPVGTEEVRGVETARYKATIDLLRYKELVPAAQREKLGSTFDQALQQAGLRYVPVDLWVDGDDLVRKMTMTLSMQDPSSSQSADVSMTYEMFDYGAPVEIAVPDATQVVDAATLKTTP